jgi:hypothetical protein
MLKHHIDVKVMPLILSRHGYMIAAISGNGQSDSDNYSLIIFVTSIIVGLSSLDKITSLRQNPVYKEHVCKWACACDNFNVDLWTYLDKGKLKTASNSGIAAYATYRGNRSDYGKQISNMMADMFRPHRVIMTTGTQFVTFWGLIAKSLLTPFQIRAL